MYSRGVTPPDDSQNSDYDDGQHSGDDVTPSPVLPAAVSGESVMPTGATVSATSAGHDSDFD